MRKLIALSFIVLLSACGSTSSLRNTQNSNLKLDFSNYNSLIINDFGDKVSKSQDDPNILSEGKRFADIVASKTKAHNIFASIDRNVDSTDAALLIDGSITQYTEGNVAARMLIGFGAGSSHFDAKVYFRDNRTKQVLGEINVDQMSWALGGALAGAQDVKSHMTVAASKIANELKASKLQPVAGTKSGN